MPLSSPALRKRIHDRTIECIGYEREDGLWDIEGHLTDVKTQRHVRPSNGKVIEAGTPIHDMWIRMTIDIDYKIHRIEVAMDACPRPTCLEVLPNVQKLVGLNISRGFNKILKNLLGNINGCTHLSELIRCMATASYQATSGPRNQREGFNSEKQGRRLINTCITYASDSPAVLDRFPNLYTGKRVDLGKITKP